jgi:hypothetical protein
MSHCSSNRLTPILSEYLINKGEIIMTVTVQVEILKKMEAEIARLQNQIKAMQRVGEGFDRLDTDNCLNEVYNG